jgi:hypothetical protein
MDKNGAHGGPGQPRPKMRPCLTNNQGKKGWRLGSSGTVPAQKVRSPEFKPHYHQKEKKMSGEETNRKG